MLCRALPLHASPPKPTPLARCIEFGRWFWTFSCFYGTYNAMPLAQRRLALERLEAEATQRLRHH